MNFPLMPIPFILPRPPLLRSIATHDPALKAMECKMLAFVMSTKIVETSKVRVAVLIGTKETAFRDGAEFRGPVDKLATETILGKVLYRNTGNWYLVLFSKALVRFVPNEWRVVGKAKLPKLVDGA
jgi:hypothetical protein